MSQITLIGAEWCSPCKYLKANIAAWAKETHCEIPITYEEFDGDRHCVDKVPTLTYTYDGLEKARMIGVNKTEVKLFLSNSVAYDSFLTYGYGD